MMVCTLGIGAFARNMKHSPAKAIQTNQLYLCIVKLPSKLFAYIAFHAVE